MCEFCTKHGEGKKWYLSIKNYSLDLLSDLKRRKFIGEFMTSTITHGDRQISRMEGLLARGKKIPPLIKRFLVWRMKRAHYGQVVPLEDVDRIFNTTNAIVRLTCVCRWAAKHKEGRYCFGISLGPPHWFDEVNLDSFGSPDVSRFESLSSHEAMEHVRSFDGKGLVHTVWTFRTPFIGAVCNCDRAECLAMRSTLGLDIPLMFRAEYVAEIEPERCLGCRECLRLCQFGALVFSSLEAKCFVAHTKCYGCGVCRSACKHDAIRLVSRTARVPASLHSAARGLCVEKEKRVQRRGAKAQRKPPN
ncbi:MAG: ATP-binding protein [Acidobacteriota bacterium]